MRRIAAPSREAILPGRLTMREGLLDDDGTLIALSGEFDVLAVGAVERRLDEHHAARRPVCLDMRQVDFVDSSALALLLRVRRMAWRDEWSVRFVLGEVVLERARRSAVDHLLADDLG